ncbi:MAG: hypothetical protein JWP88_2000 [Flaviaesturariibacter sp.]|nr:hypothetical protein [Flaviaesturariibacter sp.]
MRPEVLAVRPLQESDIDRIADYWLNAEPSFMQGMGVDLNKLPARPEWRAMLEEQISKPLPEKKSYCLIWLVDGDPVGHSNINKIIPGVEAYMHLHLWSSASRSKGLGVPLVKRTLPHFFQAYDLKRLYCEPYALNPAPNKTLEKLGFELVDSYTTTPGWINFEQPVNLWCLTHKQLQTAIQ